MGAVVQEKTKSVTIQSQKYKKKTIKVLKESKKNAKAKSFFANIVEEQRKKNNVSQFVRKLKQSIVRS